MNRLKIGSSSLLFVFGIFARRRFMPRRRWSDAPLEWVQNSPWSSSQVRAVAIGSRSQSEPLRPRFSTASDREWRCKEGSTPRPPMHPATVVREGKTPSRSVSRLWAALNLVGDGNVEGKRALKFKAQKQAEEMLVARQIEVTKDIMTRVKKRMLVADENIRFVQVALQDAMGENDHDTREVLWPKHVSNASKRRPCRFARLRRCPIWKPRCRGCEPNWHRWRLRRRRMCVPTHHKVHLRQQTC